MFYNLKVSYLKFPFPFNKVGGGYSFHWESVIKAFISDTGEALNFVNTNLVVL